jgi:putative oxidoreductase
MLSIFPQLLTYSFFAPFLLRIVAGAIFVWYGYGKLVLDADKKSKFFESIKMKPGWLYVWIFGLIELIGGVFIIVGFMTQLVSLVFALISLACFFIKWKNPDSLTTSKMAYVLLFVIFVSLILTGPGFKSFDLPL